MTEHNRATHGSARESPPRLYRVIGIGQRLRGDDGVGPYIIEQLGARMLPDVELYRSADPVRLIDWLDTDRSVIIVDAFISAEPTGEGADLVRELDISRLADLTTLSSHGLGVVQAIELAYLLFPGRSATSLTILGVRIDRSAMVSESLSPSAKRAALVACHQIEQRVCRREEGRSFANH